MILLADSGATKTEWCVAYSNSNFRLLRTDGINPFHQPDYVIRQIIAETLLPQLSPDEICDCSEVRFYGAGCLPLKTASIIDSLIAAFPNATVYVDTDLLGTARALCGHKPGVACILGTGSNSCLYDGERILRNVPPLGYILGDEGSGAYLGRRFISDCLKGLLPTTVKRGLMDECRLSRSAILDRTYSKPEANKFLASVVPYIYKVRRQPAVSALLFDCFRQFFWRNVISYGNSYPVSFTGSVAWFFREEVTAAATACGIQVDKFVQNPIDGIREYHLPL